MYDAKTKARALELYSKGASYEDITARLGPSRRAIRMWAREAGLPPRSSNVSGLFTEEAKRLAVEMYVDGYSMLEIGARTGAGLSAIRVWADRAGVKRRGVSDPAVSTKELKRLYCKLKSHAAVADVVGLQRTSVSARLKGWRP